MIEIQDLTKRYGAALAVDGLSFGVLAVLRYLGSWPG
jgi:hypothetical protein